MGRSLFRSLFVRIAVVILSLLLASFIAFPSFPSAGILAFTPATSVDRSLKSDRLPLEPAIDQTEMPVPSAPGHGKIPIGCERAFSSISAPRQTDVFRRCIA